MDMLDNLFFTILLIIVSGVVIELLSRTVLAALGTVVIRKHIADKGKRTKGRMLNLLKHYDFLGSKDTLKDMEELKVQDYISLALNVGEKETCRTMVRSFANLDFLKTMFLSFIIAFLLGTILLSIYISDLRIYYCAAMLIMAIVSLVAYNIGVKKAFELAWNTIYIRHADKSYIIGLS